MFIKSQKAFNDHIIEDFLTNKKGRFSYLLAHEPLP